MKFKRTEIIALILIIVLQSVMFIPFALNKSYIHMDEASALGHAGYNNPSIQDNGDFFDTWHGGEYYEEYLALGEISGNIFDVYKNQMKDIDPPLYYMILRLFMNLTSGGFSILPGILINTLAYAFVTIFLYLIVKKLFWGEDHCRVKSLILTLISSLTLGTLSCVIFIGPYAIMALEIVIFAYLHIRMYEIGAASKKYVAAIAVTTFLSLLTSYYTLLFIIPMYILFCMRYTRDKDTVSRKIYGIFVPISALCAIITYPFAIINIIFGGLGGEIVGTLGVQSRLFTTVIDYIQKLNFFGFNNMILAIIAIIVVCVIVKARKDHNTDDDVAVSKHSSRRMIIKTLLIPCIVYFIGVIVVSEWTEYRYIAPIMTLVFVTAIYGIYRLIKYCFNVKVACVVILALFLAMGAYPVISGSAPECTYADKRELMEDISGEYNIPAIYVLNTDDDRFLDDILLFCKLDRSYITDGNKFFDGKTDVSEVLKDEDLSGGMLVFINNGQATRHILDKILSETDFDGYKTFAILNSGNIYYFADGIEKEDVEESEDDKTFEDTVIVYSLDN